MGTLSGEKVCRKHLGEAANHSKTMTDPMDLESPGIYRSPSGRTIILESATQGAALG